MSEPLYGSGVPMWSGVPSPGFTWLQPPLAVGNQLMGPSALSFGPTVSGQVPIFQAPNPLSMPGVYSNPVMGPDMSANTTAPARGTADHTRGSWVSAHHTSRLVQPIRATNSTSQPS